MVQSTSELGEELALGISSVNGLPGWRHVSEYLLNGGSNDMVVDGSGGAPVSFSHSPPANYDLIISRIMVCLQASSAMSVGNFADLAVLGHGIEVKADGVLITTWQDNMDMYTECYDVDTLANVTDAAADTTLHLRWSFYRDLNGPGLLVKDTFEVIINDDLSGLATLRIKIKGKLVAV